MMNCNFSIIIPVYNTEKYIERALDSIISQPGNDYEIILINDGSTDSSDLIICKYIDKYPLVSFVYHKQLNRGQSDARNVGLKLAKGEYIICLDSDDALNVHALEKLRELISLEPDVLVNRIATYYESNNNIKECRYIFRSEGLRQANESLERIRKLKGFWYATWCIVPKRRFLLESNILFEKGIYHEDELWVPLVLTRANTFVFNDYCYYINTSFREGSTISTPNIKKEFDKLVVCDKLFLIRETVSEQYKRRFINNRIFYILLTIHCNILLYKNDIHYHDLRTKLMEKTNYIYENKRCFYRMIFNIIGALLYLIGKLK